MTSVPQRVMSVLVVSVLAAACASSAPGVASGGPSPSDVATPAPTAAGPASYAAWIERQGFGGSSGLNNVVKLIHFAAEQPARVSTFDIDDQTRDINALLAWLDTHPATSCWTDHHAAVRASLTKVLAAYAMARTTVEAGKPFPADVAKSMIVETDQVLAVTGPTDCP